MKRQLTALVLLFFTISNHAQINAVTENGDEVILFQDNTWKYSNDSLNKEIDITQNDKLFIKEKKSSFLVKSKKTNIGVWINPKIWSFSKQDSESASEYNFKNKKLDIYGMLITEKFEMPIESLINIAYDNAKNAAPDIKIVEKEYRNINNHNMIMMKMKGTIQGIKFIYYSYYYSNSEGSYQFITYTSQNAFEQYEDEMTNILNGLTEY